MTDSTTPVSIPDMQDPLPESNWMWRRVYVFAVTAIILWFLWGAITRLGVVAITAPYLGVPALLALCKWLIGFSGVMSTFYLIAPSAEQVVKALQVSTLLQAGVKFASRQISDADGSSDTATTAGTPPSPPVPLPSPKNRVDHDDSPPWDRR